jgi:hypothetical protein
MTNNIGGDGRDVWPWLGNTETDARSNAGSNARFDVEKLDVWLELFEYMQTNGVVAYLVLLDDDAWTGFNHERYYREMIARFGHLPALMFNISEESGENYSFSEALSLAQLLKNIDPYDHPVGIHNINDPRSEYINAPYIDFTSIQTNFSDALDHNDRAVAWINECKSLNTRVLMVGFDEPRPLMNRKGWWSAYMGGAVWEVHVDKPYDRPISAWEPAWTQIGGARTFMESLPFWEMEPMNNLVRSGTAFALAKPGEVYAFYLPSGGTITVSLAANNTYDYAWWNPSNGKSGNFEYAGTVSGGAQSFTSPGSGDWALRIVRTDSALLAANDAYVTDEDTSLTVPEPGVLGNDWDADGDPLTAFLMSGPSNGALTLNADGSFTYAPDPGFHGTDSFTYVANNGMQDSNEATVKITVNPVTDPTGELVISNLSRPDYRVDVLHAGKELYIDRTYTWGNPGAYDGLKYILTANDDKSSTGASFLSFVVNQDVVVYVGYDSRQSTAPAWMSEWMLTGDAIATTDSGTRRRLYAREFSAGMVVLGGNRPPNAGSMYNVIVRGIGDPMDTSPVAANDAYTTDADTPLTITAPGVLGNDWDADGDLLSAVRLSDPGNGTLWLNADGSFTYTPDSGFSGTDAFAYAANDGVQNSNSATVQISVSSVNARPVAANDAYTTDADTPLTVTAPGVLGNDWDADGDPLTTVLVRGPRNGALSLGAHGSFSYTPDFDFGGTDSFIYVAYDGLQNSNMATVSITVRDDDSDSDGDGIYDGDKPMKVKQTVIDSLESLLSTGDQRTDKTIEEAIVKIMNSLSIDLWESDSTLTENGKKVFDHEKEAVKKLMKIDNDGAFLSDMVRAAIDSLVEADRLLAQTAIDEAVSGDIDKAYQEMEKAQKERAKGSFDKAIEHYKKAWEKVSG